MASYYTSNGTQDQGIPLQQSPNGQTNPTPRHGGGHTPAGSRMGNASNSPPLSSSSQPSYTQPSYQGATQYGSSYVSGSSTVPQASSGRHGGGHVPGRAFTSPPPQQNPNYPQQAYYANQQQQAYASYGQAARGVSSQGQYSQPEVASSSYSPPQNNQGQGSQVRGAAQRHDRTFQKGHINCLQNPRTTYKWPKFPHAYQMPGLAFIDRITYRHRDTMQRVYKGVEEDRYLSPYDGHLAKLVVQSAQDVYDGPANSTWRRTFARNGTPSYIRIANFPFTKVPVDPDQWTNEHWTNVCLKWLPACVGLLGTLAMNPNGANGQIRNYGNYDPFPYRHWLYPEIARNIKENPHTTTASAYANQRPPPPPDAVMDRALGPRDLCFIQPDGSVNLRPVRDGEQHIQYVFIGYTAEQFNHDSEIDMAALDAIAFRAAHEAGVAAYWVGSSCLSSDEAELVNDVYRISDVIRSAHSLAIAVGPSPSRLSMMRRDQMLKMWGERMWTLPEALLSSNDHDIKIFMRDDPGPAWVLSKKHFAATVWDDPLVSRQLVDHYIGNLNLSRLEMVTIALKCLSTRKTYEKFPGDIAYVLMGLMRRRPEVNPKDSKFKAFARLSLANDSDMLLERLMCTQPKHHEADWCAMEDAWDANLWDISPHCQVAGIGPGDTVILDGAWGAAIRWKSFAPVAYVTMNSFRRIFIRMVLHGAPLAFLIGVALVALSGNAGELIVPGGFFLAYSLVIILLSPFLVRKLYGGKLWGTQAWFFGFEGYMDLATIEAHIFGAYMARLKWSAAGSPISAHVANKFGECVGIDPTTNPAVRSMVERSQSGQYGDLKVFTLVDTVTLTVTMFTAVRPPIAVLLCGHEGGMQRAVMSSYDWKTQTLYREAVLRMETPVLERMSRVSRFRFGFSRPMPVAQKLQE